MFAEKPQTFEQQIAEIAGVEVFEAALIGRVEVAALAGSKRDGFPLRNGGWRQSAVFPTVDEALQLSRRPTLFVDVGGLDNLLEQPHLIVVVKNCKTGLEPDQFDVAAQNLDANRMERAEPAHALDCWADQCADAVFHLARGFVCESHR